MEDKGKQKLDEAVDELEEEVPSKAKRFIEWARSDRARIVRIPLALTLIAVGLIFPYLPVVGIEDVPLGLLLLSYDVPFLRKPMARMVKALVRAYRRLKARWARMKARWRR